MLFDTITTLNGETTVRRLKTSVFLWAAFLCMIIGLSLINDYPPWALFFIVILFPILLLYPVVRLFFFGGRNSFAAIFGELFYVGFYGKSDPQSRLILKEEKNKERERINIRRRKLGYEDLNENYIKENAERTRVPPLALAESSSAASKTVLRESEEGLMSPFKRGFEILSNEGIINDLELLSELQYLDASYLHPAVKEYSHSKAKTKIHSRETEIRPEICKFKVGNIQFEIINSKISSLTLEGESEASGDVTVRVNNEIVLKLDWSENKDIFDRKPINISDYLNTHNVIKLKKDWVEALKLFFQFSRIARKEQKLKWEKKNEKALIKNLSDNVDLGDYE